MVDQFKKWFYGDTLKLLVTILLGLISYFFVKIDEDVQFIKSELVEISQKVEVDRTKMGYIEDKLNNHKH